MVWAAGAVGVELQRSSFAQYDGGTAVAREDVQAGDLVFFDTAGPGPSDVGIASGPDTVISATTHGVREHELGGSYWGVHYVGARRLS
jgi:cell wall-associated NlpC family hydrolase